MDSGHTAGVLVWSRWWPVSSPSHTHSKNKHVSCQFHISMSWQSSKNHCVSFHFDPGGHMPSIFHVTVASMYDTHTCVGAREKALGCDSLAALCMQHHFYWEKIDKPFLLGYLTDIISNEVSCHIKENQGTCLLPMRKTWALKTKFDSEELAFSIMH